MDTGLRGRTVIVTGANANIGRGVCLAVAAEGANVVVVGRDEAQGARVTQQALDHGASRALWQSCDVTDRDQVSRMVSTVHRIFGSIDVLVNGVGGNVGIDAFVDSAPETWTQDIALNMLSVLNCTHAVLPAMIANQSGRIVNIGSTSGIVGDPLLAVYSAMKGGVHAFTKVLAKEVGVHGITVNAVAPYATIPSDDAAISSGSRWHPDGVFPRLAATRGEELASAARKTVLDRQYATSDDVAAAVVYLASAAAGFVTGQVLAVDGGTLIA